jgi:O-antigen/teichoic acid export membrane protein
VLAWQFCNILTVPQGFENTAVLLMGLTVLTSAVQLPFSTLSSALVATESYWLSNLINAVSDILRVVLIVLFFEFLSTWVVWVAVATMIASFATTAGQWYAVRRILPAMRVRLSQFDVRLALRVMSFSLAVFLGTLSGVLYWDTDRIVINKLLTAEQLTIYAVVTSIAEYLYQLLNLPTMVLFPVIVKAEATKNIALVREMVFRGTRLCVLIALPCWLLFAALAEPFFRWYLKSQYQDVTSFVPLVAAIYLLSCSTSVIRLVPIPMGRPMFVSIVEIVVAVLNVILTVICVGWLHWGLAGCAFGTLVAIVLKNGMIVPWYVVRLVHLNVIVLLRDIFYAIVPTVLAGAVLAGLMPLVAGLHFAWLALPATIAGIVLLVASYAVGLPRAERQRARALFVVALGAAMRMGKQNLSQK